MTARAPRSPTSRRSSSRRRSICSGNGVCTGFTAAARRFILPCGAGQILLQPEHEAWTATYRDRDTTIVVAARLPLDYAQGAAEDYVRRAGTQTLVDPHAAWRARPASDRQRHALRRFRLSAEQGLTAGEASDRLARAIALARESGA